MVDKRRVLALGLSWWSTLAWIACSEDEPSSVTPVGLGDASIQLDGASNPSVDAAEDAGSDAKVPVGDGGLVSPAICPLHLISTGDTLYWTETWQPGYCPDQTNTPGIRSASMNGTPTLPPQVYAGAPGFSGPIGIFSGDHGIHFTDGQTPHNDLWRLEADGGATRWSTTPAPIGPGTLVGDVNRLYWTSSDGTHLSHGGVAGPSPVILATGAGAQAGGGVQTLALDNTSVYSIRNVAPNQGLYSCLLDQDCSFTGAVTIALEANIQAVSVDDFDVWFTGGDPVYSGLVTTDKLYRCPKAGCPNAAPVPFATVTSRDDGKSTHQAIANDAMHVYFSTIGGAILRCNKSLPTCDAPEVITSGARPTSFVLDGDYLYWADRRGGIYKLPK